MKLFENKNNGLGYVSILIGTLVGLVSMVICLHFKLAVFGVNISVFISPMIAGFVETYFSRRFTSQTTGAISAIILFVVTNIIGWFFPLNPITWGLLTFGGLGVMLQAAFPLAVNYILWGVFLSIIYVFGMLGGLITKFIYKDEKTPVTVTDLNIGDNKDDVLILTTHDDAIVDEYKGLVIAEEIIEFEDKSFYEKIDYLESNLYEREELKHNDYIASKNYILSSLRDNAISMGADAIIDVEIEYTNYNQQLPPDLLIAAYGTAIKLKK